jgi:hypothetical protein
MRSWLLVNERTQKEHFRVLTSAGGGGGRLKAHLFKSGSSNATGSSAPSREGMSETESKKSA